MKRVLTIILAAALGGCASQPEPDPEAAAAAKAGYSSLSGGMAVGVIPAGAGLIRDTRRSRDVPIAVEYPTGAGPFPVVIFSHDYGGMSRGYVSFGSNWASHGFVVIRPAHADAGTVTDTNSRDPRETWGTQTVSDFRNRADDLKLVLDSFEGITQLYPELKGKLDATRIGIAGHGYGAYTAMLFAGMTANVGGVQLSYADPRVKAAIAMSPHGISPKRGLTASSWEKVRIPVLYMTGTSDRGVDESEDPAWRKLAFDNSPAGDKWFVSLAGATHYTFSGRPFDPSLVPEFREPPLTTTRADGTVVTQPSIVQSRPGAYIDSDSQIHTRAQAIALAFWDLYLRNEQKAREYLDRMQERGGATVEKK